MRTPYVGAVSANALNQVQGRQHQHLFPLGFDARPVKDGKRELVIGKGVRGYVALYRYLAEVDTVFILAIRAQRESGFKH